MKSFYLKSLALVATLLAPPAVMAQAYSPAELQQALDASFGPWESQELGHWANQSGVTLDGVDAVTVVPPSTSTSPFLLRAPLTGPTTVHFSYLCGLNISDENPPGPRVQTGAGADTPLPFARFWQEGSIEVPPGNQMVTWRFPTSYLGGHAFLDQVWTDNDPRPRVTSDGLVETQLGLTTTYPITTNKPCDSFAATGLPPGMTIDAGSAVITGAPTELGSYDARVIATNAAGSHTRPVLFRVLAPSAVATVDLATALDGAGITWSQQAGAYREPWIGDLFKPWADRLGSTQPWSGSATGLSKDGADAATVPLGASPGANRASDWLRTEVQGPGTFSFWHRLVTFPNSAGTTLERARLVARIDGTRNYHVFATPEGTVSDRIGSAWQQRTIAVPAGRHLLEFLAEAEGFRPPESDSLVVFDQASFVAGATDFFFKEWRDQVFPYSGDPMADWEGDGYPLLIEFALGGSPAYHDAALLPEVAVIDGHLTMTVYKPPGALGLEYTVQANKSLAGNGWTTFGTEIMNEDAEVLIVRCKKTVVEEPSCMLRLRVRLDDSVGP